MLTNDRRAIKEANARAGEYIAVLGAGGGLGHLAVQYAAYMGLKVIAVDTGDDKQQLVKKLGAEAWVDFKTAGDGIGQLSCLSLLDWVLTRVI